MNGKADEGTVIIVTIILVMTMILFCKTNENLAAELLGAIITGLLGIGTTIVGYKWGASQTNKQTVSTAPNVADISFQQPKEQ